MNQLSYYLYKGVLYDTKTLQHWGVLGMKWGVRRYQNKDGTLTAAGKKRYSTEWVKKGKNVDFQESPEHIFRKKSRLSGNPFADIRKSLKDESDLLNNLDAEAQKLMADYKQDIHKYTTMAAIVNILEHQDGNVDMESIGQYMFFYDCDDGDQGDINSRSLYVNINNKAKELRDLTKQIDAAEDRYLENAKKATKELLGEYGDTPMYKTGDYSVSDSIAYQLRESIARKNEEFGLREGNMMREVTDSQKSSIEKAKAAVANLDFGKQGAWNIVEAIRNAGLSGTKFNEMTSADWLKINSELKKLEGTW